MSSPSLKILFALGAVVAVSACASRKPPEPVAVASTPTTSSSQLTDDGPPPRPPLKAQPIGAVPGSAQDFVIAAGDRVFFDYDQYAIRADGRPVLDKQAQWLGRYPQVQVRVEGNADERGTEEYNFALAARRAEAVKAYLIGHGVPAGRITTISYGKERPLDEGASEESMAKNRNGHTAITTGGAG